MTRKLAAACRDASWRAALVIVAIGAAVAPSRGQDPAAVLYRIFLTDGSTLVSFGEFARVADRVVFSMPLGGGSVPAAGTPRLKAVSIPASAVDWTSTDRYVESARAAQYASTRGEAEFATVNAQVAWALNEIALSNDAARRLQLAEQARRALAEWSRASYGYRAKDIADLAVFLDEIVSELRAAAGADRFELSLVANAAPPSMPLLPPPTLRESIEQVLAAARLTPDPAGRIDLLRTAVSLIDEGAGKLPASWATTARADAAGELGAEARLEKSYSELSASIVTAATSYAKRADVRAVERLRASALRKDEALGRRRPETMSALLTVLDEKLDAARRLRLARDSWEARAPFYRAYRQNLGRALKRLTSVRAPLDDIRRLAGPSAARLTIADRQLAEAARALSRVTPPADLAAVHALFASVLELARHACQVRRQAVESGDMTIAWNASSAAAGALILFDRATADLARLLRSPELP